jgi:hypothetical protein
VFLVFSKFLKVKIMEDCSHPNNCGDPLQRAIVM